MRLEKLQLDLESLKCVLVVLYTVGIFMILNSGNVPGCQIFICFHLSISLFPTNLLN